LVADESRITCCLTVLVKTEAFEDILFWYNINIEKNKLFFITIKIT
jgi:hypothetical protein